MAVANDAAVAGQHRDLETVAAARERVGVDVANLEHDGHARERGDELLAERTIIARVDDETWGGCPGRGQWSRSFAADAGPLEVATAAGLRPVAMYLSVRCGTSPTTVTW